MVKKIILAQVVAPKVKYYLNNKAPSAHPREKKFSPKTMPCLRGLTL